MNYKKHYDALIERAKTRQLDCYTEKHHIIPRCMNGTDTSDNLVSLTAEEHYVAHQLLVKMYPKNRNLVHAAMMMVPSGPRLQRRNKAYGWLRRRYSSIAKQRIGSKNGSYGRSWYYDPKTLKNGKFLQEDVPVGWMKGRTPPKPWKLCKICNEKARSRGANFCSLHYSQYQANNMKEKWKDPNLRLLMIQAVKNAWQNKDYRENVISRTRRRKK